MKTIEELKALVDFIADNHPGCELRFTYPFRANSQTSGSISSYQICKFDSSDQVRFYLGRARQNGKEAGDE